MWYNIYSQGSGEPWTITFMHLVDLPHKIAPSIKFGGAKIFSISLAFRQDFYFLRREWTLLCQLWFPKYKKYMIFNFKNRKCYKIISDVLSYVIDAWCMLNKCRTAVSIEFSSGCKFRALYFYKNNSFELLKFKMT